MTDPRSAYIHRSWLVDADGGFSENVNKVAIYYWDTSSLAWVKATGGAIPGANVNVTNFPANYTVLQGTSPWTDNISQWGGVATSQGQKAMAASVPIVIASDQSTLNTVSLGFTDHYNTQQYIAPNGELVAVPLYKLIGDVFTGTALDPNFWTISLGTGGTANIAGGELTVSTGTTANNAVELTSIRTARFSGLAPNKARIVAQLPDTGVVNNSRHWGVGAMAAGVPSKGAFFEMSGTTFQLTTTKASVTTAITNGNFNGQYGATFNPGTVSHFYEIIWQPRQVVWLADNRIIHTLSASTTPWTDDLNLPLHLGNVNSGGLTTNVDIKFRIATAARFGIPQIQPTSAFLTRTTVDIAQNLKNTPGNLHGVTISGVVNNAVITLYNNTTATGAVLWTTGAMSNNTFPFDVQMNGIPFTVGLSVGITGAAASVLVKYE